MVDKILLDLGIFNAGEGFFSNLVSLTVDHVYHQPKSQPALAR
jgi:hypothetical protein